MVGPVTGDDQAHADRDPAEDGNDEDPQRIQAADVGHSDRRDVKAHPLCYIPAMQGRQLGCPGAL